MPKAISCASMFAFFLLLDNLPIGAGADAGTEPAAVVEACVVAADEGAGSRALDLFAMVSFSLPTRLMWWWRYFFVNYLCELELCLLLRMLDVAFERPRG